VGRAARRREARLEQDRQLLLYPGWWEGNAMAVTLINESKWKELPKLYQIA
jgi:TRAP-type mannitol/chloroaromatic compound transport system substrate-binding protein